jgi:hypothetical protein
MMTRGESFRRIKKEKSGCKKDSVEGPRKKFSFRIMIGRDYLKMEPVETESE